MTDTRSLLLTAALLLFILGFIAVAKRGQRARSAWVRMLFGGSGGKRTLKENLYPGLREQALSATPTMVGLDGSVPQDHVYGVVMEWPLNGAVLTLVGFENGDSSLYLSSGQIMIGGVGRPAIAQAARDLVRSAQPLVSQATVTNDTFPALAGTLTFYLLTGGGRRRQVEQEEDLKGGKGLWAQLGDAGQRLITEWRLAEQKR